MARRRMIKPEFFTDSKVTRLTYAQRLLFIGLWCEADDSGVVVEDHRQLCIELFPADREVTEEVLSSWIDRLEAFDFVERYHCTASAQPDGTILYSPSTPKELADDSGDLLDDSKSARKVRRYLRILNFHLHQYLDHPSFRHPLPDGKVPASPNTRRVLETKRKERNRKKSARATTRSQQPEEPAGTTDADLDQLNAVDPFPWPALLKCVQSGGRTTGYMLINEPTRAVLKSVGIRWADFCNANEFQLKQLRSRYEQGRKGNASAKA